MAHYNETAFIVRYGDLATALRNFDAVRYTTVACAALASLGCLCLLPREFRLMWRQRFTLTRFLLILNQVFTLVTLCSSIYIFTMDRESDTQQVLQVVVRLSGLGKQSGAPTHNDGGTVQAGGIV
ncbi:hypothetical protein FRB94_001131 [Tulasnella sp. JGI-2019a]|nr:hypothetical protein FRB94_001131 [Tulasnella sp. JGI-2019a]KAG9016441.1 hypothetical protein FRB93_010690 [Tulasnella sp. JGI-2019a]KAG9029593.1 hypothetical protein FRB95_005177 [Tulasnella sp. JGI-2019a]